jgi:hypothetical protein
VALLLLLLLLLLSGSAAVVAAHTRRRPRSTPHWELVGLAGLLAVPRAAPLAGTVALWLQWLQRLRQRWDLQMANQVGEVRRCVTAK